MARKDKKQASQPAWAHRVSGRTLQSDFLAPNVDDVTIPGLPNGLFPRASLDAGITLKVPAWLGIPDDPNDVEYVSLEIARSGSEEWNVILDRVEYVPGTTPLPFDIKIPSGFLLSGENEGAFKIRYFHENLFGNPAHSDETLIYIDKIPPNFPNAPGKVIFDFGVGPIFDTTLASLSEIEGAIPDWTGGEEGDLIAFTWVPDTLPDDPYSIIPIDIVPGADGKVNIPVSLIKSLSDGRYCCGYTLIDKAGNRSFLSDYDLISVALGDLPPVDTMAAPTVPEALDGVINRADANAGVHVEFPSIPNGKSSDEIEIVWGASPLNFRTKVGANPRLFSIPVPAQHLKDEYGTKTGEVDTSVHYIVYRAGVPFESLKTTVVKVDFSKPGPENPDWPKPTNPALSAPKVFGQSDVENVLSDTDEDQPIRADIILVDPLVDGDTYQVHWNGTTIGAPYTIDATKDVAGDTVEIDLDWDVIRAEGNNAKMPVYYSISNSAFPHNDDSSSIGEVKIEFLSVDLPLAEPQQLYNNRLTCRSLYFEDGTIGFKYLIPNSIYLKEGMTIDVEWKAYTTYSAPVLVPAAGLRETLGPISADQAKNGVLWFIQPYDEKIIPTYGGPSDQMGKGEVIYTIEVNGKPESSTPSDTQVAISSANGTCELP